MKFKFPIAVFLKIIDPMAVCRVPCVYSDNAGTDRVISEVSNVCWQITLTSRDYL